jgi:hypothetical protein
MQKQKKENTMSKSSKSCGYTGHMRIMDKVNNTKAAYQSEQAKSHGMDSAQLEKHPKHKIEYPEVSAQARAQAKCNCKK